MTAKRARYVVKGCGELPLDMLRYDQSWPATNASANAGQRSGNGLEEREVVLETDAPNIHPGRWSSFGWQVVEREGVQEPQAKIDLGSDEHPMVLLGRWT